MKAEKDGEDSLATHVEALAASGMNRADYCRRHGIEYKRLYDVERALTKTSAKRKPKAFARVKPTPAAMPTGCGGARLVLSPSAALEFAASTDPRWIARVLAELGGAG